MSLNDVLQSVGIISIDSEIKSGTKKVGELLKQVQSIKSNLSHMISIAISKKQGKIDVKNLEIEVLKTEISTLDDMAEKVAKLAQ